MSAEIDSTRLKELRALGPWLIKYNVFVKAKNLGIKFSPNDITSEELLYFSEIKEEQERISEAGKDGK